MPPRHPGTSDPALLRRLLEFGDEVGRATSGKVLPLEGGHAVIVPSAPLLHDANYVAITDEGRPAAELAELAERVMAREGLSAISVAPLDPAEAERLAPGFDTLGWEQDPGVYMVHRREPDRPAEHEVAETTGEQVAPAFRKMAKETWVGDYSGDPDDVADQFVARELAYATYGGDRWFVAQEGGEPAACCYLIERDGLGQVETVITRGASRNRGLGRAVVLTAIAASRESGNELTFIGAERDDWPKELYRRLGFDPVGIEHAFVKKGS